MDTKDRTVNNASPFEQIFKEHVGKVSDKWQLYLNEYESVFEEWRNKPVRLLEIGTQNGGSLEIFSKYFANAQSLTGCDIEPKCAELRYVDPRISVIIGDVNSDECEEQIANVCPCFDIIVDDGSHNSSDIIRSFSRYFKRLGDNGIYVVEDMHASYWAKWGGGLHVPYSAMAFFKRLADVISHEHWRLDKSRAQHLKEFAERFCVRFDEGTLSSVHSITFANSLCFIRKCPPAANKVGPRVVAGKHEPVLSGVRDKGGTSISNIVAENPDDEHLDVFRLVQAVEERAREVSRLESALTDRQQTIHAMLGQIETLTARMKDVERRADTQAEQGHRLNKELWDAQTRNSELAAVADERAQAIGKLEAELERWRESCSELRAKAAALEERAGHWERTAQRDHSRLEAVERELASYQEQVQSLKGHTAERDQRLRDLERKLANAGTRARNMEDVAKQWAKRLAEQETKLAGQRDAARQAEQDFAGEREKLANLERKTRSSRWLFRQVARRLVHAPSDVTRRASQRRKDKRRYQRNYRLIAESELFDRNWYVENNPDVAAAGIDPVRHYLLHGGFEGRAPSPDFDSAWYLAQNRDVTKAGFNPLLHYLHCGKAEDRPPSIRIISNHEAQEIHSSTFHARRPYAFMSKAQLKEKAAEHLEQTLTRGGRDVAIFTAIINKYDAILCHEHLLPFVDYYLFTDTVLKSVYVYKTIMAPYFDKDPVRSARFIKTHAHMLLPNHKIAIWSDGNLLIRDDISELISGFEKSALPVAAVPHPLRASVYEEARECIKRNKDSRETIETQMQRYRIEGFDCDDLIETNFMMFRLDHPKLTPFLSLWWAEIERGSRRDQLSINYALRKTGAEWHPLTEKPNSMRNHKAFALFHHGSVEGPSAPTDLQQIEPRRNYAEVLEKRLARQKDRTADIVVCVHNALEAVTRCLNSVVENRDPARHRIVIIDDGSGDETRRWLVKLANREPNTRIIRHETAKGYTGAANAGLRAMDSDLVILLNSDTEVGPHWVDKLLDAAFSNPGVGIVGPLSNAASHQSIPNHKSTATQTAINHLPSDYTVADMNVWCERNSPSDFIPRVPFVHGFCFGITYEAIESTGYLDEENFPYGYGEENDYCIRAINAGLSLAVATHTFVYHQKSQSYPDSRRQALTRLGNQKIRELHGSDRVLRAVRSMQDNPHLSRFRTLAATLYPDEILRELA